MFRKEAMESYAGHQRSGGLLRVQAPSGLAMAMVLAGAVVSLVVVSAIAHVEIRVAGEGRVTPRGGPVEILAPVAGHLVDVVEAGVSLGEHERVAAVETFDGTERVELTPAAGVVDIVRVRRGSPVERGEVLARMATDHALMGYMLVGPSERGQLAVGATVQLHLHELAAGDYARASIRRISSEPVDTDQVRRVLGREAVHDEPKYLVELDLSDSPRPFRSGMTFTGEVSVGRRSVLSVLIPALAR